MGKYCFNCKWHSFEIITYGFVCTNSDSPRCASWTDNTCTCDSWEEKKTIELQK